MDLERCEETRLRVLRGDGLIGILPVEEIERMVEGYRALGEAGVAEAWRGLAEYHLDENGLHPSLEDAAEAACRAVALGSAAGRELLRRMLPVLRASGLEDPPSAAAARAALARSDDPDGAIAYVLGLCAYHGFGGPQDLEGAVALHRKAAERGHPDAMFELYALLSTGQGVERDDAAALDWCLRAAERGHPRACYNLGAFYATGRGVARDEAEARRWYARASEAGHARATATLAVMVATGAGGEVEPDRAEALFALAAEQGFDTESFREQLGI